MKSETCWKQFDEKFTKSFFFIYLLEPMLINDCEFELPFEMKPNIQLFAFVGVISNCLVKLKDK